MSLFLSFPCLQLRCGSAAVLQLAADFLPCYWYSIEFRTVVTKAISLTSPDILHGIPRRAYMPRYPTVYTVWRYPANFSRYSTISHRLTTVSHGVYGISPTSHGMSQYRTENQLYPDVSHGIQSTSHGIPRYPADFLWYPTDSPRYPTACCCNCAAAAAAVYLR